jgi:hypothetical protein
MSSNICLPEKFKPDTTIYYNSYIITSRIEALDNMPQMLYTYIALEECAAHVANNRGIQTSIRHLETLKGVQYAEGGAGIFLE